MHQTIDTTVRTGERDPGPEPAGRRCMVQGCRTWLSRYNGTEYCGAHRGWYVPISPRQARAEMQDYAALMAEDPDGD